MSIVRTAGQAVPDDPHLGSFHRPFCPATDGIAVIRRQAQHEWLACRRGLVASSTTDDSGLCVLWRVCWLLDCVCRELRFDARTKKPPRNPHFVAAGPHNCRFSWLKSSEERVRIETLFLSDQTAPVPDRTCRRLRPASLSRRVSNYSPDVPRITSSSSS